jgi:hypothetical protein
VPLSIIITDDLECRDEEQRNPTIRSTRHIAYRCGWEVSLRILNTEMVKKDRQTAFDMAYNS